MFVAVPLPEPVKDSIERAQRELRSALPETSVRWTKRDQFHVTLRFLGDVESLQVDDLIRSVRGACGGLGALELRAAGIGMFPNPHRPRVVWAHVDDRQERLASLQRAVEHASAAFTSEKPERTFTGHVTLGRCRTIGRGEAAKLLTLATSMERRLFGEWTADSIEIVRSELGPGGSRHTTLAVVPLAGDSPATA